MNQVSLDSELALIKLRKEAYRLREAIYGKISIAAWSHVQDHWVQDLEWLRANQWKKGGDET